MNLPNVDLLEISVDGQETIFPNDAGWAALFEDPTLDGLSLYAKGMRRLYLTALEFSSQHRENFALGLYRYGRLPYWTIVTFLKMPDRLQRVQIENLCCRRCGWSGLSANPLEGSLYYWVDREDAELRAIDTVRVVCPKCHGKLPRPSIWIEHIS